MMGGLGHSFTEVGKMTPDQVYLCFCDDKMLKTKKGRRTAKADPLVVQSTDGMVKGRTADGKPIQGRIAGKSLASQLREQAQAKRGK